MTAAVLVLDTGARFNLNPGELIVIPLETGHTVMDRFRAVNAPNLDSIAVLRLDAGSLGASGVAGLLDLVRAEADDYGASHRTDAENADPEADVRG